MLGTSRGRSGSALLGEYQLIRHSYAYLEGIAFRHGDIVRVLSPICACGRNLPPQEDILAELLKQSGTGLLSVSRKFGGLDIKRVYFG